MEVIKARSVGHALVEGLIHLDTYGVSRPSRNGGVLWGGSVSTVYLHPENRVLFEPIRDANPFFHLYEALWMILGRNDVKPLKRYAKQMEAYSDDAHILHGAYGHRWRNHFMQPSLGIAKDQLNVIVERLKKDPTDRRCVLQMWDPTVDLGYEGKDFPCNVSATFQIDPSGRLCLSVFCRSNDIIWGAYGANAVHFSMLLEYMSVLIGVPMGTYTQISINYHAYEEPYNKLLSIPRSTGFTFDRYLQRRVLPTRLSGIDLTESIRRLVRYADSETEEYLFGNLESCALWEKTFYVMLRAHKIFKAEGKQPAIDFMYQRCPEVIGQDWIIAGIEWLQRRKK